MHCFVHNVGLVKTSNRTDANYFEVMLQEKNNAHKALCFYPEKHSQLTDAMVSKSPVKLSKYNVSNGQLYLNKSTLVSITAADDVSFEYDPRLAKDAIVSFKDLHSLAPSQFVNVRISVLEIGDEVVHQGVNGPLAKQEVTLVDATTCVKLTLYGDDVNTLEVNNSYTLKNVRLYNVKGVVYLNTSLAAKFKYEKNCALENLSNIRNCVTETKVTGKFIGVTQIQQFSLSRLQSKSN